MTSYERVTKTLVSDGYLSEADVDAAIAVLKGELRVAEAAELEAESMADLEVEQELIDEASDLAAEAERVGDTKTEAVAAEVLEEGLGSVAMDAEVIETAEEVIEAAYLNAAAALVEAELINNADQEAMVVSIKRGLEID